MADSREHAARPYSETAATHIRQLAQINQHVPELLRTSATVLSLLTNRPVAHDAPATQAIQDASYRLFLLTNTIRMQLHKHVDQLLAENVVPAEPTRIIAPVQMRDHIPNAHAQVAHDDDVYDPDEGLTNGGLGELDIADLNARAGVGQQGSDDILARVKGILRHVERD